MNVKPLEDARVLVVAQTPRPDDEAHAVIQAEEAVIDVVRALGAAGAIVDVIADSSLSLLAAVVAGEYYQPRPAEETRHRHDEKTPREERRVDRPVARIHTRAVEELTDLQERGAIEVSGFDDDERGVVRRLASNSAALILIGDGETLATSLSEFQRRNSDAPVFVFGSTGRDARNLHARLGITVIDLELDAEAPPRSRRAERERFERKEPREERREQPIDFEFQFPPIALAAQEIVRRLAHLGEENI